MPKNEDAKHLSPDEIHYLALEGGGGKGFAYLGAIEVLEKLHVMEHVYGFSGTSAGAITALMLSLGMTTEEIISEIDSNVFSTFMDSPRDRNNKRLIPQPLKYIERDNDFNERYSLSFLPSLGVIPDTVLLSKASLVGLILEILVRGVKGNIPIYTLLSSLSGKNVKLDNILEYLTYFDRDMGFCSGQIARTYFEDLISRRLRAVLGNKKAEAMSNLTFANHKILFQRDLLVCGSNLSTGKTELFSWRHTPNFPVADAIRISMGFPIVYKPYVITKSMNGWPPCGTYVDGGLWNNLPFREIGSLNKTATNQAEKNKSSATHPTQKLLINTSIKDVIESRQTLGMRLEIVPPEKVLTGTDIVLKLLGTVLSAGESQIIADLEPFTLLLDTDGLETLKFSPDSLVREKVRRRSHRAMYRYFGYAPPLEDMDKSESDDQRINSLVSRNICD